MNPTAGFVGNGRRILGFLPRRDVAQPGRALAWGARGRQFKSARPDHSNSRIATLESASGRTKSVAPLLRKSFATESAITRPSDESIAPSQPERNASHRNVSG